MIDRIGAHLSFQSEALQLRSLRQQTLSANLVNGETPGYRAQDFDFSQALKDALQRTEGAAATGAAAPRAQPALFERGGWQPSMDGNTVDPDAERAQFADNALRYEAALRTLNHQIKTLLSAIQG